MKQKAERPSKRGIVNFFGAFGYFLCSLLWFWTMMLYFSVIQSVVLFLSPPPAEQIDQSPGLTLTPPNVLEVTIAVVVTVIMLVVTIYVLVRMPLNIAKTSRKAVHKTTAKVVPIAIKAQHKKGTKKRRAWLTARILLTTKILLVIVPVILIAASRLLEAPSLDYLIAVAIGGGLAGLSIVLFAVQYLLASILRVKISAVW